MIIKKAESEEEFEAIFKLNYQTFVEEIPQHEIRADRKLVDKFHESNTYWIALKEKELIGMISYNTQRPFSLDYKQVEVDNLIPKNTEVAEIRLLAIKEKWRKSFLTYQLIKQLTKDLAKQKIELGLISAAVKQLPFYKKLGFIPFGEMVGKKEALYQPMYISTAKLNQIFKQ